MDVKSEATIKRCIDEILLKRREQLETHETGREDFGNATVLLLDELLSVVDDAEKNKQTPADRRQAIHEKERLRQQRQLAMLLPKSSRNRRSAFDDEDDGLDDLPPSTQVSVELFETQDPPINDDVLQVMAHRHNSPPVSDDDLPDISSTQSSQKRSREWADDEGRLRKREAKARRNKTEIRQEINRMDQMFDTYLENSNRHLENSDRHNSAMVQLLARAVGSGAPLGDAEEDEMGARMSRIEESQQEVKNDVVDVKNNVEEMKNMLKMMADKILRS